VSVSPVRASWLYILYAGRLEAYAFDGGCRFVSFAFAVWRIV
jgi:hypothetical protein